jgi:hypothetical protein
MITPSILKHAAINLEQGSGSIAIGFIAGGKFYRFTDQEIEPILLRICNELAESVKLDQTMTSARDMECERYSEFEDY